MPSSLQYPLGRQRDLQRRWSRLLQRTAPPTTMRLEIRYIRVQVSLQLRDSEPTPRARYRPLVQDLCRVI
jgi:hypothetical protein